MDISIAKPPYYTVIFTSLTKGQNQAYKEMADKMLSLAAKQEGFLGVDSVREQNGLGITVSYWRDLAAIHRWKQQTEHLEAQKQGKQQWYSRYRVQVCKVEREYGFEAKIGT